MSISNIVKNTVLVSLLMFSFAHTTFSSETDSLSIDSAESTKNILTINGSVDAYFRQNITGPNGEKAIAPKTSFANLNGFALGMANVILTAEHKKIGSVIDLAFGPRAEDADFNSPLLRPGGISQIVNQLFVFYQFNDDIKLTLGNFNTFLGYEYISAKNNFNYSTSYLFSYGPFSHTGIKADFTITDDLTAIVAILNKTDATEYNPGKNFTLGAQLGYKGTYINALYGKQSTSIFNTLQIDLTSGLNFSEALYLGINSSFNSTEGVGFYGLALYPQVKLSDSFKIGARAEYFAETNFGVGAIGTYNSKGNANIYAATLTGSYTKGGITIKPEFRLDTNPKHKNFLNNNLSPTNSLVSFVLAAIYSF